MPQQQQQEQVLETYFMKRLPPPKDPNGFSAEEKRKIVAQCTEELISLVALEIKHSVDAKAIRSWVREEGKRLPTKYKLTSSLSSLVRITGLFSPIY